MTASESGKRVEPGVVFLIDVDNTLLDNDRLKQDLARGLEESIGPERSRRFWDIYEEVRGEAGYVDYPTTVEQLCREFRDDAMRDALTSYIFGLPFARYLFPGALETIERLKAVGEPAILSDGDPVFQPWKIKQSGIEEAVDGRVLIFVHKEESLPEVFDRLPARHYVAIDDKPGILSALERYCPTEFTTILVLQGKYAETRDQFSPAPDYIVSHIAEVQNFDAAQLSGVAAST